MMLKTTLENVLEEENIQEAIIHMKGKKDACDDSGLRLHQLDEWWADNRETVKALFMKGEYTPKIEHEKILITPNGKHRKISSIASTDRLFLRAIQQCISPEAETFFLDASYAFRSGRSTADAVKKAREYIESGKEVVAKIDFKDFFDNIPHEGLLKSLKKTISDRLLLLLFEKYIVSKVERDGQLLTRSCGISQGSSISPVLSNIFLHDFDKWMAKEGLLFIRFADDISVFVDSMEEGYVVLNRLIQKFESRSIPINHEKSGVFSAFSRPLLGYRFEKEGSSVLVSKTKFKGKHVFSKWHKQAIEKIDQQFYLINDGILTRRDFTLLFENEEKKFYFPIETTEAINVYSNVELTSGFLSQIRERGINVNIFDQFGVYAGCFYTDRQRNRIKTLMKQVRIYDDEDKRLEFAKKMDMASIHNLRCNLKYYNRKGQSSELSETIDKISLALKEMNEAKSVDQILLIEARCRQRYYRCFNNIINDEKFKFLVRTKQPPKDAINSLISFGNMYLYQKIAQNIYKTSLDIRISFVHSSLKRYENLNLDIADLFKPIIVDRVIFALINKKMISATKHFEKVENEGIYLNVEGKRIYLSELEKKMRQVLTVDGMQMTYERLLMSEVRSIEAAILKDKQYKPFKYRG